MSAQDIIYITPTEFNAVKDTVTVCEKIQSIYKNLCSDYDCFTKPELIQAKFNTHTHHRTSQPNESGNTQKNYRGKSFHGHLSTKKHSGHNYERRHHQHHQHHQLNSVCCVERPQRNRMNVAGSDANDPYKDVKRVMKGLMNIINKNNYRKVFNKVKLLLCEDNVGVVIAIILETACLQVFFLSIFYQLLEDVLALLDTQHTLQVANGVINEYIDTFIDKAEYMFCASDTSSHHPYMLFCMQQKHKSVSSSRNLVVLELIQHNFSSHWTVQGYCNRLLETLGSLNERNEHNERNESVQLDGNIEVNTDIIVGLIKEIKNKSSETVIDFNHLKNIKGLDSNSRLRFMIDDLFESSQ
jgi:hypothetical protein